MIGSTALQWSAMFHLIRFLVRSQFRLSSRARASAQIRKVADAYLALADGIDDGRGRVPVEVPPMMGVDEDMRRWSFFMLLEHNAIVNRSITSVVEGLVRGEVLEGIDPKRDVMPSPSAGIEQVGAFRKSVERHLSVVPTLGGLRGTVKKPHPIFGPFDAHGWHCMFGLHLKVHLKQAKLLAAGGARS